MKKKVIVVGAGLSGMATGAYLAKEGFDVEIFEKHDHPGGRAGQFSAEGFHFDIGPQYIIIPEILEAFFKTFSHSISDYFDVNKIDPLLRIFHKEKEVYDIPSENKQLDEFFNRYTKSGDRKKKKYLDKAEPHYRELLRDRMLNTGIFTSKSLKEKWFGLNHFRFVSKLFKDYHLVSLLEFPFPLLGQLPLRHTKTNFAFNYSLLNRGILYPNGGMQQLIVAFTKLLDELNVPIHLSSPVESYDIIHDKVTGIITHGKNFHADYFIAATDYHFAEQLLPREYRNYSENDWETSEALYSSFIFYLGINKRLNALAANSIIFTTDLEKRIKPGMKTLGSLEMPALFITCPAKLNKELAPEGMESLIIRCIIPPGIEDNGKIREHFYEKAVHLLEKASGEAVQQHIVYKKTYAHTDFETEFGIFKGKAYGWLHTQFALNKRNKKVQNHHLPNFFYAEHPVFLGAGVSSAILSGEWVSRELIRYNEKLQN